MNSLPIMSVKNYYQKRMREVYQNHQAVEGRDIKIIPKSVYKKAGVRRRNAGEIVCKITPFFAAIIRLWYCELNKVKC